MCGQPSRGFALAGIPHPTNRFRPHAHRTQAKAKSNQTRKTHPPIAAYPLSSTSTSSQDIRPGNASTTSQNPSSALLQLAKQGFCFSWDSDQPPRFAQEETSQKPEPKLKQTRSSTSETKKTRRCQPGESGQPSELLESLESLGFPKSAGCSFSTGPAGSAAPATPSIWEVNKSVNSPPLA